ncbi:Uncharacterised protein [Mycobacteroides abscessus subsp. abscessus]|nr:Uncharacterised protein [Mycobacteroides abscessus subsp. abscessus]
MAESREVSPYCSRCARNSLVGPGNNRRFSAARRVALSPSSWDSSSAVSATSARAGPRPCSARVRNGSGQPPGGSPSSPRRNPMTDSGISKRPGSEANSSALTPVPTSASARSPTTLDDGVTLTNRPSIRSAAA